MDQDEIRNMQRRNNPVTIDDIKYAWKEDMKLLSGNDVTKALSELHNLHAKYSQLMHDYVVEGRKLTAEYAKLYKARYQYYRGDLNSDPDELKKRKWEPNAKKIDTSQIKTYLEGDELLVDLKLKMDLTLEIAELCKSYIEHIKNSNYSLNSKVKWMMFTFDGSK